MLKVIDFGAFVELEKRIEGLVHVSEISEERVEDQRSVLKPAQEVKAQIITVDPIEVVCVCQRECEDRANGSEVATAVLHEAEANLRDRETDGHQMG